jgi:CelD/BcsL family acetyltransferase involved in cellulose biosynthesis
MFRHAIEVDKVRLIDFGTGDEPFKAHWMDQVRPLYRLRLHNPATFTGAAGALRDTLSAARAKVRRARQTGRKMS